MVCEGGYGIRPRSGIPLRLGELFWQTGSSKQVRDVVAAGLRVNPVSPGGEPSRRPGNFRGISQVATRGWYNLADFRDNRLDLVGPVFETARSEAIKRFDSEVATRARCLFNFGDARGELDHMAKIQAVWAIDIGQAALKAIKLVPAETPRSGGG